MAKRKLSEQRARVVTRELLSFRGWDLRPAEIGGQLLEESEFIRYEHLAAVFESQSKTGDGLGRPDFLLLESYESLVPQLVVETKASVSDINQAIKEAIHYGNACHKNDFDVLAVAVAGAEAEICAVRVLRRVGSDWKPLTLHGQEIDWIPSPAQTKAILATPKKVEVAPERPPDKVLIEQANRLNEILRECDIRDEFRAIYAATFMLALWYADVVTDKKVVLSQINNNARAALEKAGKLDLSKSLRVEEKNAALAAKAWQIVDILKKLNIRSFMQEHDYLGQLYETFFKYTGGNTIGQYFTPRHIIALMCDLVEVGPKDRVFDPACGTGGFLIGALNRMISQQKLTYQEAMQKVKQNLFGIEPEPTTAALCVTNMILRGDGTSGIIREDCFEKLDYPPQPASISLLNPPFPHDPKKDIPASQFIDRALSSVTHKGIVASVVPYSLLLNTGDWHRKVLKENQLLFVATMPADLFSPYANFNTAIIILKKGVPQSDNRTFFCRLWNDGFKVKKNARVPREGSQIERLKTAWEGKENIPEFSAYARLTADASEWAPEAYLASAPHKDVEFIQGFEDSIRKQAAFYVHNGHRLLPGDEAFGITGTDRVFASETAVSLEGLQMGAFNVADHFEIKLGGKQEIEDLEDGGTIPVVTTSEFNNGVSAWKKAIQVYYPPAITVATDGSTCSSFVQEYPFYSFYKVAILKPKVPAAVPVDAMYYIAYLLSRERWRYVYARKFGKSRLSATILQGPVKDGEPDFATMAKLTQQCSAYPIIASFRRAYKDAFQHSFDSLVKDWKRMRGPSSSAVKMASLPPYQQIISLGAPVLPLILAELKKAPEHWFVALNAITKEDPVGEQDRGRLPKMAEAWLAWGRERGLC